mmetsp:Transcript_45282/g.88980  ORF Transcript_45282/g.88980 Transcript_45282/m.88980 type:complete len:216 (-) Transcript_45282:1019-1666(-)
MSPDKPTSTTRVSLEESAAATGEAYFCALMPLNCTAKLCSVTPPATVCLSLSLLTRFGVCPATRNLSVVIPLATTASEPSPLMPPSFTKVTDKPATASMLTPGGAMMSGGANSSPSLGGGAGALSHVLLNKNLKLCLPLEGCPSLSAKRAALAPTNTKANPEPLHTKFKFRGRGLPGWILACRASAGPLAPTSKTSLRGEKIVGRNSNVGTSLSK